MYGCTLCSLGKELSLSHLFLKHNFFPSVCVSAGVALMSELLACLNSQPVTNKQWDWCPQSHRYSNTFIRVIWAADCLSGAATVPLPLLWQITSHAHSWNKPKKVETGQRKTVFGRREKEPRQESGEEILVKEHYRNCRRLNFEENLVFETECLLSKRTVKIELSSALPGEAFYALL